MPQLSITDTQSGHFASVLAMFDPLYSVTNGEQYEKCLWNHSSQTKILNPCHMLLQINTYMVAAKEINGTQRRTKVSPDACTVAAVVGKKAHLELK